MDERKVFAGLGILAAVMVLFALFSDRNEAADPEDLIAEQLEPGSEELAALSGRIEAMEGAISEMGEAGEPLSEELEELAGRIDAVEGAVNSMSEDSDDAPAATNDTEASEDTASTEEASATEDTESAPAEETETAAAADEATEEEAASAPADEDVTYTPGQTAVFAEGALRVFVSRLDLDASTARLSVNGETKTLASGQARTVMVGKRPAGSRWTI